MSDTEICAEGHTCPEGPGGWCCGNPKICRRRKLIDLRIGQAKYELSGDEFTEDQLSMLCVAFDIIAVAIKEATDP